ncbi:hypothetical protein [Actinocrispum wychmicini]|nr:hypothetical protein [Actinocrispum wychmicini]
MSGFPFFCDSNFRPFRYVLGHKQLWLRSDDCQLEILFTAVERMELDSRFTGGLTIASVSSHGDLDDNAARPLLLLTLTGSTFGSGFVACSQAKVSRIRQDGVESITRERIFWEGAVYSEHAVGGQAAEPGEVAFGLPVLRRYAREKRTTPRFPPPQD